MKKKLELLSTIVMLAATVACIAVNFSAASKGLSVEAINITATVFFLLFWALISRLETAAKTSALIALYTMVSGVLAICATLGGWASLVTNIITAPAIMMFYGLKFFENMSVLYVIMSIVSFVILIYSLITLANRKPVPVKAEEEKAEEPQTAESIDISETELVSAAAEYVEMINTFENKEIELPQEDAETTVEKEEAETVPQ